MHKNLVIFILLTAIIICQQTKSYPKVPLRSFVKLTPFKPAQNYATCNGIYLLVPQILVNQHPIWMSVNNQYYRIIFRNPSGNFCITAANYLQFFMRQNLQTSRKGFGAFHCSKNTVESIYESLWAQYKIQDIDLPIF